MRENVLFRNGRRVDSRFIGSVPEDKVPGRMMYVLHVGRCDEPR